MSELVPFGTSPLCASWQGYYSTTNPAAVGSLVTQSIYNCTMALTIVMHGHTFLDTLIMTLEQPSVNAQGAATGIDDANYIPMLQQFGRGPVDTLMTIGGATTPDTTNTITWEFDTPFVTDVNPVNVLVFQSVPFINALGEYAGGGNP